MKLKSREAGGPLRPPMKMASGAGVFALAFASLVTVGAGAAAADEVLDSSRVIDLTGSSTGEDLRSAGWTYSERPADTPIDWAITDNGQLRISNAVLSNNLNFLITPRLGAKAGEPVTDADFDTFEATFQVAAFDGEYQEGLRTEISVNDDKIARTGGTVVLHHNEGKLQIGAIWTELGHGPADWFSAVLTEVDPSVPHTVRLVFRALEDAQDTLDVYVDGELVGTVGTYEEYHLTSEQLERKVASSLMFRAWQAIPSATGRGFDSQPAVEATRGKGFLIDDIAYSVYDSPATPDPVLVTASDLGADYDHGTPWTTAHVGNPTGEYNFVLDADKGAALELVTSTGTQTRILHYLDSGAYPSVDAAAVKLPHHGLRTLPLGTVAHAPISVTYSGDTYLGTQMELWYGWDESNDSPFYTTLRHNLPGKGEWTTADLTAGDEWTTSRKLTRADGSTFLAAHAKATLLDIAAALASQQPRVQSFGLNKGSDSNAAAVGAVRVSEASFLGQDFVFHAALPSAPAAPTAVVEGTNAVVVSWSAPDAGTSPITGYVVTLKSSTGAVRSVPVAPGATSHKFSHLAPGSYAVTVTASNALGISPASAPATVLVAALDAPAAPAAPTATAAGDDGVSVSWSAPADGGTPVTGYTVVLKSSTGSLRTAAVGASTSSHVFTGLPAGSYTATVAAINAVGSSAASAGSATITVKSAVTIHRPFLSKSRQIVGSKDRATVSAVVIGAEGSDVDFYDGSTKLGTASVTGAVATITLARNLKVGKYNAIVAKFAGDATRLSAESATAPNFRVVRTAPVKKIRVTGKKFKKNARPKVTIRVGRFDNGKWATGKLSIRVNGKVIRTVNVKAKNKGKITVNLPKSKRAVKVRAGFTKTPTVKKSWSKVTRIQVR